MGSVAFLDIGQLPTMPSGKKLVEAPKMMEGVHNGTSVQVERGCSCCCCNNLSTAYCRKRLEEHLLQVKIGAGAVAVMSNPCTGGSSWNDVFENEDYVLHTLRLRKSHLSAKCNQGTVAMMYQQCTCRKRYLHW